jgi:hypothetical protein
MRPGSRSFVCAAATLLAVLWLHPLGSPRAEPAARVVAIGDIHGAYDEFVETLRRTGLVDDTLKWSGDRTVLVQTGDFLDRGAKVREVMDLLMALEPQARAAGGRVEVLLGNHEAMNLISETRDVNPEAYARFADANSEARREKAWDAYVELAKARAHEINVAGDRQLPVPAVYQPPSREEWLATHPPGYLEYLDALGPQGVYGRWLRGRPATLRIGDTVFVHGGFNPEFAPKKLDEVNDQVRKEIERFDQVRNLLVDRKSALPFFRFQELLEAARATLDVARAQAATGDAVTVAPNIVSLQGLTRIGTWSLVNPNGPLWFRGFATWSSDDGRPQLEALIDRYKAVRFVVGHTMTVGFRIMPRFSQRVFLIDTGMLSTYYKGGRASALEIKDDRITALYADGQVVLSSAASAAARELP